MTTYGTIPSSSDPATKHEFISRAKDRVRAGLATRRPWKELFPNFHSFNFPFHFREGIARIRTNVAYFLMNYTIIILGIIFLSLLWHPISLIVFIVMMAAWLFLYFLRDEPLVILHRTIGDRVVLIVLSIVTLVALLLTRATLNIVISLVIGVVVVLVHAAIRKPEDLFVDEESLGKRPLTEPLAS